MSALHASGRDAQAFEVYDALCRRLREHLGVEPSAAVQALHVSLLRAQPPAQPGSAQLGPTRRPPAQLPNDMPGFMGREEGLRWLDGLLEGSGGATAVISAVAGMAGVGKTALAVRWGHRVRDRFVDGQLYINLQGYAATAPMSPLVALGQFLRALGVPAAKVPSDGDEAAALYRTEMAGRRMLVVLDNAATADQVRPLLPGTPGCVVLVTSRDMLTGLVAVDGARRLDLDVLPPGESVALLARILGDDRVAAAGDGAARLARACGHLPLALRIVGANLLSQSDVELDRCAAALTSGAERLEALRVAADERASVRAAFDASYRRLPADVARGFRLLGLHIGPDITVAGMASLTGLPMGRAREIFAELARAHLIDEHQPGRYALHDLVRAYAAELVQSAASAVERHGATVRLLDHYLHSAFSATLLLDRDRDPPPLAPPTSGARPESPADYAEALEWFTTEHAVLLAAVDHAAANGFDARAWQLAWTMTVFLDRQGHWHDWAATARSAVVATERLGDRPGQANAHRYLAGALMRLRQFDQARVHYGRALELFEQTGDTLGQARTNRNLGQTWHREGHDAKALDHARRALDLYRAAGHRQGEASILNVIGWYSRTLGDYREMINSCQQALDLLRELDHRPGQADAWDSLGFAYHHLGDTEQAIACYEHAVDLYDQLGHRYEHAETLVSLADAYRAAGNEDTAGDCRRRALAILADLDQTDADRLAALLRGNG